MIGFLLASVLLCAAPFELQTVPLAPYENPATHHSATVFLAPADNQTGAEIFVLDGHMLKAYAPNQRRPVLTLVLAPEVSGFDIADVDLDGYPELIALRGKAVLRYDLRPDSEQPGPTVLFETALNAGAPHRLPYACVIVFELSGQKLLALPCEDGLELRTIDGALVDWFPFSPASPFSSAYGAPFSAWSMDSPQAAAAPGLEMRVRRTLEYPGEHDIGLAPGAFPPPLSRRGPASQARAAAEEEAPHWLWFPLARDEADGGRALYAITGPDFSTTQIRIRDVVDGSVPGSNTQQESAGPARIGPPRNYPGILVLPTDALPDFNGDGFTDLLLWRARRPGTSIDALTRLLSGAVWPVQLTAHVFLPEKGRYAPRPSGGIPLTVPLAWLLDMTDGAPLRHVVMRDLNDDGRTDLGLASGEHTYSIWLFDEGFDARPDFSRRFPEPIEEVSFAEALRGRGTSIGLRGTNTLYVLHPTVTGTRTPVTPGKVEDAARAPE